jgi:hypothetical protein
MKALLIDPEHKSIQSIDIEGQGVHPVPREAQ